MTSNSHPAVGDLQNPGLEASIQGKMEQLDTSAWKRVGFGGNVAETYKIWNCMKRGNRD